MYHTWMVRATKPAFDSEPNVGKYSSPMDPMGNFNRVLITAVDCWKGADLGDHDKRHLAKHEAWTKSAGGNTVDGRSPAFTS